MILKFYLFLLSAVHIYGFNGPRFRSSIMEGNKPILRMAAENTSEQIASSPEEVLTRDPDWMTELRTNIKNVVDKLGHKAAKLHIKRLVEDTENNNDVRLYVEVNRKGISNIKYKYNKHHMRAEREQGRFGLYVLETTTPESDPQWLVDLKVLIKELIGRYGKRRLDEFITPVIKAIQKQHNVEIKDIDGEVFVNYVKKTYMHKKRFKRTRKQFGSSDESDNSDDETDMRRVTEIPMEK